MQLTFVDAYTASHFITAWATVLQASNIPHSILTSPALLDEVDLQKNSTRFLLQSGRVTQRFFDKRPGYWVEDGSPFRSRNLLQLHLPAA